MMRKRQRRRKWKKKRRKRHEKIRIEEMAGRRKREARPNMAACIPVVDGEASSRASERPGAAPKARAFSMPVISRNAPVRVHPIVCIPASRAVDGKTFSERESSRRTSQGSPV